MAAGIVKSCLGTSTASAMSGGDVMFVVRNLSLRYVLYLF